MHQRTNRHEPCHRGVFPDLGNGTFNRGIVLFKNQSLGRTDLPETTALAVYNRMRSDRVAHAAELRANGEREKLRIEAEADKERTIILAEAQRKAQILRGEGEAGRNAILSTAFGTDMEFFQFYRSLETMGEGLGGEGTPMVLSPESKLLKFLDDTNPDFGN